jgi:predicted ATPase
VAIDNVSIRAWRPWRLSLDRVGPFRESVERIVFNDAAGNPANMYMLAAGNGRGKTTILEAIYFAMRMLAEDFPNSADLRSDIATESDGRLQLDLILELEWGAVEKRVLLSLSWGNVGPTGIAGWANSPLEERTADCWLRFGWQSTTISGKLSANRAELPLLGGETLDGWLDPKEADAWLASLLQGIRTAANSAWAGFNQELVQAPTVLYFTAARDIAYGEQQDYSLGRPSTPRYTPAHRFEREGGTWLTSLDNMLVWFYWIDPVEYRAARLFINSIAFRGDDAKYIRDTPGKDPPQIMVSNRGSLHSMDRLSSGERNVVQFALRFGAHRTANTIVLVDELELHLHPELQRRLMQILKEAAAMGRSLTVIFTTHSLEVMREFRFEDEEPNLRKGGELLLP